MSRCPQHGVPRSVCQDPETVWYPQRSVDHAEMAQAAAVWMYASLHDAQPYHDGTFKKWSEKRSEDYPYHFNDGVRIWVSTENLNPDDTFYWPEGGEHGNPS